MPFSESRALLNASHMGSRLRDHARALAEGLATESRTSPGTLRSVAPDEDGICVTLGLRHAERDIALVLMFEVRPKRTSLSFSTKSTHTIHHQISAQLAFQI